MEVPKLRIIRTVFQDVEPRGDHEETKPKCILVLDMENEMELSTSEIPDLVRKMEFALPGIFPDDDSPLVHSCGGLGTDVEKHSFREEIERGTTIPHLLEHVIIYLLSRRSNYCSAYCGQRSVDLDQGITTHYYLVMDYTSKLEAVVAVDLGFQLISAWVEGRAVAIDPAEVLDGLRQIIEPMVQHAA